MVITMELTQGKLQALVGQIYQIHLVAYNKTSQREWRIGLMKREAFLMPDLMAEHPVASSRA